jgi:hypothetical protein
MAVKASVTAGYSTGSSTGQSSGYVASQNRHFGILSETKKVGMFILY